MKHEMMPGDIFMIPLFLPSYQEWRGLEELMDYRRYQFHLEDVFAFGRLIELEAGNLNLVEIFSYVGRIPNDPKILVRSGRMFAPVTVVYFPGNVGGFCLMIRIMINGWIRTIEIFLFFFIRSCGRGERRFGFHSRNAGS